MEAQEAPKIISGLLVVKEKFYLTPHYIRIILTGEEVLKFGAVTVGANNKIMVPQQDDLVRRTYTLRALDLQKKEMTVDFVAHGEDGPASAWAIQSKPGSTLQVLMKDKTKSLYKPSKWYLMAGDHTALPVISVLLERISPEAEGDVYLEVYSETDVIDLVKPENIRIHWLFNSTPGQSSLLAEKIKSTHFPPDDRFVFAAAESATIKEIQHFLKEEQHLDREEWQAYAYWKLGVAEGR